VKPHLRIIDHLFRQNGLDIDLGFCHDSSGVDRPPYPSLSQRQTGKDYLIAGCLQWSYDWYLIMRRLLFALLTILVAGAPLLAKSTRSIHVFVALCDNDSQGIVPVPKQLGNGDDPRNNLYWGALYGVKTFLRKDPRWTLIDTRTKPARDILERCIFRHNRRGVYLVADAWRGASIKKAVKAFLAASAGHHPETLKLGHKNIRIGAAAELVCYVGHNGLMDFKLDPVKRTESTTAPAGAIALACKSKPYFQPRLTKSRCRSVLLTTGLMAPEAYTLVAAVEGWIAAESGSKIRQRAAKAYNRYQKCGLNAARNLFYCEGP